MKVTVEFPDSDLKEICRVTGERKKGPAIRKLVLDALMMKRREEVANKFISGEWGAELAGFEAGRAAGRASAKTRAAQAAHVREHSNILFCNQHDTQCERKPMIEEAIPIRC